jgi:hypothetical protein
VRGEPRPSRDSTLSRKREPWMPRTGRRHRIDASEQEWMAFRQQNEQELRARAREEEPQWRAKEADSTEPILPVSEPIPIQQEQEASVTRDIRPKQKASATRDIRPKQKASATRDIRPKQKKQGEASLLSTETNREPSHIRNLRVQVRELRHAIQCNQSARDSFTADSLAFASRERLILHDEAILKNLEAQLLQWKNTGMKELAPKEQSTLLQQGVVDSPRLNNVGLPPGQQHPKKLSSTQQIYERDNAVRAWVLEKVRGICELCLEEGPFLLPNGERYLEVHHVVPLAEGGPDTVSNAVGLCPNCHRRVHLASDARDHVDKLYAQVHRLRRIKSN